MAEKYGVITVGDNDFLKLLKENNPEIKVILMNEYKYGDLKYLDGLFVLGGNSSQAIILPFDMRNEIDSLIRNGKKVFCEFVSGVHKYYGLPLVSTRFRRLVVVDENTTLSKNNILEDQNNEFCPVFQIDESCHPWLIYKPFMAAHKVYEPTEMDMSNHEEWAIWQAGENLLNASFRLCNFNRARMSPLEDFRKLMGSIYKFVTGNIIKKHLEPPYELCFSIDSRETVRKACQWYIKSGTLLEDGNGGVREGFCTEIDWDGTQKINSNLRADCCGESSMAFFLSGIFLEDKKFLKISDVLEDFLYDKFMVKSGELKGMIRWSDYAFTACYGDDMARAMMGTLLKALMGYSKKHLDNAKIAIDFLIDTSGMDGLRVKRTDVLSFNKSELQSKNADFPSAHYNAYPLGCFALLGYILGDCRYVEASERGMQSLMRVYPDTLREQSETQELSRLLLPLAWIYLATGKEIYKDWIYRVFHDLEHYRNLMGGYTEWDTGYKANFKNNVNGECSVLVKNGDPIMDLLYTNNWLLLAFVQCGLVTGDNVFFDRYEAIRNMFCKIQIKSNNPVIDGAWARAFDYEMKEYFGVPNDIGWGPWTIESGWTMSEIIAGIAMGENLDHIAKYYIKSGVD